MEVPAPHLSHTDFAHTGLPHNHSYPSSNSGITQDFPTAVESAQLRILSLNVRAATFETLLTELQSRIEYYAKVGLSYIYWRVPQVQVQRCAYRLQDLMTMLTDFLHSREYIAEAISADTLYVAWNHVPYLLASKAPAATQPSTTTASDPRHAPSASNRHSSNQYAHGSNQRRY